MDDVSKLRHLMRAAELLVEAYRRGAQRGGSVDWSDVDLAFVEACKALDIDPKNVV